MEVDYENNRLKKQFSSALEIKKAFGLMAQKVNLRIQQMKNSPTLAVLQTIPGARCHPLKGTKAGEWAVDVSGNFRLIFEIDHEPVPIKDDNSIDTNLITKVKILGIQDYH